MGFLNFNSISAKYSNEYLNLIKNDAFTRIDSKKNGGNGDKKVSVNEAYNDLDVGSLLSGLKQGSSEYNRLTGLTNNLPQILAAYAGNDGEFTPLEWAEFLNGKEWGAVLDAYHSSSNFAKIEMGWVDNSKNSNKDGTVTKSEVRLGITNNLANEGKINVDTTEIEALIDKYAGEDGKFTVAEYVNLKSDPQYKAFLKEHQVTPFNLD